ncbi:MAG: ATP-binding protein, partial [Candidatus Uhrbacteria bacterium]|nr:ATP-binding protein [Candidatus Uhrbacteria bacterium]
MELAAYRIRNFRRLTDAVISLESDFTVLVGANNSGKTSAAHGLQMFAAGEKQKFTIHDFGVACWSSFDNQDKAPNVALGELPRMWADIWFSVNPEDLALAVDLLPSLRWHGTHVGIRVEFGPRNDEALLDNYRSARDEAKARKGDDEAGYHPWPRTLREYLEKQLQKEYVFRYFKLDDAMIDEEFKTRPGAGAPVEIPEGDRDGKSILGSLLRVDFMGAQRHLSDAEGGRNQALSSRLARFYE